MRARTWPIAKATGLNFIDYLARLRVEQSQNLRQKPHFRVREVASEVGVQSLSQFNRAFHRIVGMSPRAYRASLGDTEKNA
jgi:two-component system response regulator YesN